jgi:uncharacterized protein
VFFRAAAEIAQVRPIIVNGDPAVLTKLVAAGEIGALWQGAVVPIPSLTEVANLSDTVIFGLSDAELAAMLKMFPQLSATSVPPGTYKGQTAELRSVSAWNFVVANKDLADQTAYAITKAVLSASDPTSEIYPTAAGTLAGNAAYTGLRRSIQARCYSTPKPGSGSPRREARGGHAFCCFLQLGIAYALAARAPENEHTIAATP